MSVHVCSLLWWALWNEGRSFCLWMLLLLFFYLWWQSWELPIKCLVTWFWASSCTPSVQLDERRKSAWNSKMVAWCSGKNLEEASLVTQSHGELQKHLRQAGPHGRASQGCRGRYQPDFLGQVLIPVAAWVSSWVLIVLLFQWPKEFFWQNELIQPLGPEKLQRFQRAVIGGIQRLRRQSRRIWFTEASSRWESPELLKWLGLLLFKVTGF